MTSATSTLREAAPAKINLYLHIVGRRSDGLHLLDSLVTFAAVGDAVTVQPGEGLTLTRTGPLADDLPPVEEDLVYRAATLLAEATGVTEGAAIDVEKNLPVASGIGGGSADAAAALRALAHLWHVELSPDLVASLAQELGADLTVCLHNRPSRVAGIGEQLAPSGTFPPVHAVLVNPRVAVPTAEVFAAFAADPPVPAAVPDAGEDWAPAPEAFARQLAAYRNDLTDAAIMLFPEIGDALAALAVQPDCLLERMCGSGATCFGLFATPEIAQKAAAALQRDHPDWWVVATALEGGAA